MSGAPPGPGLAPVAAIEDDLQRIRELLDAVDVVQDGGLRDLLGGIGREDERDLLELVLLLDIARNVGGGDGTTIVQPPGAGSGDGEGERPTTPTYFSTGVDTITVGATFQTRTFEFVAGTIVLFFDDAIDISFATQSEPDDIIPLSADKSPATFSGVSGINTNHVHFRQADSASGAAELTILAFR